MAREGSGKKNEAPKKGQNAMTATESSVDAPDRGTPDLDTVRETMRERDSNIDPAQGDSPDDDDQAPEREVEDDPERGEDEPNEDE